MEKRDDIPIWVYLAFSSISTRRGALLLILSSLLFCVYCIPWSLYFSEYHWIASVFLIDDWYWFAMMFPMTIWSGGWIKTQFGIADKHLI